MLVQFGSTSFGAWSDFLREFSEFEQSILGMMFLGCTVSEIAHVSDMPDIRIRQALQAIKTNTAWKELFNKLLDYGTEA